MPGDSVSAGHSYAEASMFIRRRQFLEGRFPAPGEPFLAVRIVGYYLG